MDEGAQAIWLYSCRSKQKGPDRRVTPPTYGFHGTECFATFSIQGVVVLLIHLQLRFLSFLISHGTARTALYQPVSVL